MNNTIEQLYEEQVKSLPITDQLQLVEVIVQSLASNVETIESINIEQKTIVHDNNPNMDESKKRLLDNYDELIAEYQTEIQQFEAKYSMSTVEFLSERKPGELNENLDFAKWVNSWEMVHDLKRKKNRALAYKPDPTKRSLSELRGLGKEIWQGIDAQEYVNQLREERMQ